MIAENSESRAKEEKSEINLYMLKNGGEIINVHKI